MMDNYQWHGGNNFTTIGYSIKILSTEEFHQSDSNLLQVTRFQVKHNPDCKWTKVKGSFGTDSQVGTDQFD